MSPLLIVLIGIAVVLTIRTIRRSVVDNHSVKHHHRALDTLGEISQHHERVAPPAEQPSAHPHVRVVPAGEQSTGRFDHAVRRAVAPPPIVPPPISPTDAPGPGTQDPAAPAARAPLVFDDTASSPVAPAASPLPPPALTQAALTSSPPPNPPAPPQPAAAAVVESLATGRIGYVPPAGRKRPLSDYRAARWILAGVGVISILIGVVGVLVASSGPSHHVKTPARVASPTHNSTNTTTPSTVAPSPAELIGTSNDGAQYSLVPTAQLALVATDRCWVQIRTGSSTGPVVFQGVMQPGDRQVLPVGTSVWLRLGNPPGISIVINGQPLHLDGVPSTSSPFNITFQPSA